VRKRPLGASLYWKNAAPFWFAPFYIGKTKHLPRPARDNHRESTQKTLKKDAFYPSADPGAASRAEAFGAGIRTALLREAWNGQVHKTFLVVRFPH
jgi:hypothetical protein